MNKTTTLWAALLMFALFQLPANATPPPSTQNSPSDPQEYINLREKLRESLREFVRQYNTPASQKVYKQVLDDFQVLAQIETEYANAKTQGASQQDLQNIAARYVDAAKKTLTDAEAHDRTLGPAYQRMQEAIGSLFSSYPSLYTRDQVEIEQEISTILGTVLTDYSNLTQEMEQSIAPLAQEIYIQGVKAVFQSGGNLTESDMEKIWLDSAQSILEKKSGR